MSLYNIPSIAENIPMRKITYRPLIEINSIKTFIYGMIFTDKVINKLFKVKHIHFYVANCTWLAQREYAMYGQLTTLLAVARSAHSTSSLLVDFCSFISKHNLSNNQQFYIFYVYYITKNLTTKHYVPNFIR